VELRARRGTERASLSNATEGCLLLTAALETILIAGLFLLATHAGQGSVPTAIFLRINEALVAPLALLPSLAGPLLRQIVAIIGYGGMLAALTGAVAWFDRRQALGY
jgi:hypothetical protein